MTEARAISDEREQKYLITTLVDTLTRTEGVRKGLEALETNSFDGFIGTLVRWAPWFEKLNREFPLKALDEAIAIAAWIRPDWQKVRDSL